MSNPRIPYFKDRQPHLHSICMQLNILLFNTIINGLDWGSFVLFWSLYSVLKNSSELSLLKHLKKVVNNTESPYLSHVIGNVYMKMGAFPLLDSRFQRLHSTMNSVLESGSQDFNPVLPLTDRFNLTLEKFFNFSELHFCIY